MVLVAGIGELIEGQAKGLGQARPAKHFHLHWHAFPAAHKRRKTPEAGPSFDLHEGPPGQSLLLRPGQLLGRNVDPAAVILHEHQRRVRMIQGNDAANADRIAAYGLFRSQLPNGVDRRQHGQGAGSCSRAASPGWVKQAHDEASEGERRTHEFTSDYTMVFTARFCLERILHSIPQMEQPGPRFPIITAQPARRPKFRW